MNTDLNRKNAIAERLMLARKQAGLTQGQVAQLLDLSRPSISEAEAGRRNVTATELAKLSEIYGVSLEWLSCARTTPDPAKDARVELAARALAKLKPADLTKVLELLQALREQGDKE